MGRNHVRQHVEGSHGFEQCSERVWETSEVVRISDVVPTLNQETFDVGQGWMDLDSPTSLSEGYTVQVFKGGFLFVVICTFEKSKFNAMAVTSGDRKVREHETTGS